MALIISGNHMDIGQAFRSRIDDRIKGAVSKYFDRNFSGHVSVVKSGSRYTADCVLHLDSGAVLQTTGEAQDPQIAFDLAAERIEKRLRRYNSRRKSHGGFPEEDAFTSHLTYQIMEPMPDEDEELPQDYAPAIVAESKISLRQLSVADAVLELDLIDNPVLLFRNVTNGDINLVYRRSDTNIGWVDLSSLQST